MIKLGIALGLVMWASVAIGPAAADGSINCEYLNANPSVSDAEDLMVYTALEAMDNGQDMQSTGQWFARDIMSNCPQHAATVLQAAENISNDPRYN